MMMRGGFPQTMGAKPGKGNKGKKKGKGKPKPPPKPPSMMQSIANKMVPDGDQDGY